MRMTLAIAFLFGALSWGESAPFEIVLPANVVSETVAIRYALIGPFGGYGTWTEFERGLRSYKLETRHAGQAATRLRAIVYAPGCALQKLDISLVDTATRQWAFACDPVAPVLVTGVIHAELAGTIKESEVRVNYVAEWAEQFFGIHDGLTTTFPVTQASPGPDGRFQVRIPGFTGEQQSLGGFRFWLRDKKTGNLRAELIPVTGKGQFGTLQAADKYPEPIEFKVCAADVTPDRKLGFAKRGEAKPDSCSQ